MTFLLITYYDIRGRSRFTRRGDPLQEVTNRESVPSLGRAAGHDFWEIRRESKLNFSSLAGGHYVRFFYVRLVYEPPSPLHSDNYCTVPHVQIRVV